MAENKIQSPYFYLQSSGSNGSDGSTKGFHLRWDLLRNLGETHLPKGDLSSGSVNFNRANDFVRIRRSNYKKRFATIINFKTMAPNIVHDAQKLWVYNGTGTGTVVYVWFRNWAMYDSARAAINPTTNTYDFIQAYGKELIDIRVQDKLFFAAEFEVESNGTSPTLRAEALSVKENLPLSDIYVSCRRKWRNGNWCDDKSVSNKVSLVSKEKNTNTLKATAAEKAAIIPFSKEYIAPCCGEGKNLIDDHSFEQDSYSFQTDFNQNQQPFFPGSIFIVNNANQLSGSYVGSPHHGKRFLAVSGEGQNRLVWGRLVKVKPSTSYCFSGWLMRLLKGKRDSKVHVRIEDTSGGILAQQDFVLPTSPDTWEYFELKFRTEKNLEVIIKIIDSEGNNSIYGIDNLWLCESKKEDCKPRIIAENMQGVRYATDNAHVCEVRIETYQDYMGGASWEDIDLFALTNNNVVAKNRLDNPSIGINNSWPKFNDGAKVKAANYADKWMNPVGLKYGVQKYITLSDVDPLATETISGAQPEDGTMDVSYLDMLRLVSMDFHVARMLGLGHIDPEPSNNDDDKFIYLAEYATDGLLDDSNVPRDVLHRYMTLPTGLEDDRLPEEPVLRPAKYGVYVDNGLGPSSLTDVNGYTPDGLSRFISLFIDRSDNIQNLQPFFVPSKEFCSSGYTPPVFYGMEYRKQGEVFWRKPELAHDDSFTDTAGRPETLPIPNNGEENKPVFVHQEQTGGIHQYASYGINWFSRPSALGNSVNTDNTVLSHADLLIPPSNFSIQLIQPESPVILTSTNEQVLLNNIAGADKTLVRVVFDYFHTHDINYPFANEVELFFRDEQPRSVMGQVKSISTDVSDPDFWLIRTEKYEYNSTGTFVDPTIPNAEMPLYIGGIFKVQDDTYIINDVDPSGVANEGPIFRVRKQTETTVVPDPNDPSGLTFVSVEQPKMIASEGKFLALENMADPAVWSHSGTPINKLSTKVKIGDPSWVSTVENYVEDGENITKELRGIWEPATIVDKPEVGTGSIIGVYEITYLGYNLGDHQQAADPNPVNWYRGVVRVAKASDPGGKKKVLEVVRIENIGTGLPLKIIAVDPSYNPADLILTGNNVPTNFYPGYRAYLYVDNPAKLNATNTLPSAGDGSRKTWFGLRSRDSVQNYHSNIGVPAPLVAMEFIDPLPPEAPNGATYATPPDFYFKSTYTFSMQFQHRPFAIALYRANDDAILKALYTTATISSIRDSLKSLGEDPYMSDRWKNMMSFDYTYNDPTKSFYDATGTNANGTFRRFPREAGNFSFPNPNKPPVFDGTQPPGAILQEVKDAIYGSFTPLTEQPLMYQFIQGGTYQPVNKPQNIRNNHGELLTPNDPEYDQAPMAKKLGGNQIQFTDFTLDGASNNFYFYLGREIGNRGRMGDPGPIGGPIFLINTRPLDEPGIKRVESIPSIPEEGVDAYVRFDINGFPAAQQAGRIQIYRTNEPAEAMSIRSMQLVKTIDLEEEGMLNAPTYRVQDNFDNELVPYGDPLYYRIVALRKTTDRDGNIDWAPSLPSKLLMLALVDSNNPINPTLTFTSDGIAGSPAEVSNVMISWDTTIYNGTYFLEKMSSRGRWQKIYEIKTNNSSVSVDLAITNLGSSLLLKEANDRPVYNRFRVMVQNSSGLFGLNEEVLTI